MDRTKAQLFLSVMDTLHDFTGARIKSIEGGKMIHQMIEDMILRLLRPEIDDIKAYLRTKPEMEELYGFLDMLHKERDYYGVGNLIPPENVEASTKHMMFKYMLLDKSYKPIYSPKRDMGTKEANNVWKNREKMYHDYHCYMTDVIQINIGDKTENTGIFSLENVPSQAKHLHDYLKLVYNAGRIVYVPDANALGKEMLCIEDAGYPTVYKGIFDQYDFSNTTVLGGAPKKKPLQSSTNTTCIQQEFQEYALYSNQNELFALPTMHVHFDLSNHKYILQHKHIIDLRLQKKQNVGVLFFVKCLLKLRAYLGNLRYMTPDEKRELEAELQSEAFDIILRMYSVKLTKDDMKDKDKVREYLLSLFDLKRSGDYLAVKACAEANKNAPEGTRYVFVSNDQLAILYALMQNIPCIQTTLMGRKKDKLFLTIYNIHRQVRDPNTTAHASTSHQVMASVRSTASRMHLMSPKNPRVKDIERSVADRVAEDLSTGSFVRSSLQTHYGRKHIDTDEFNAIKTAIVSIKDESQQARALKSIRTLEGTLKKRLSKSKMDGGGLADEVTDHAFVHFFQASNALGLQFPAYFWIVFRFVFFHIPSDVLLEFLMTSQPNGVQQIPADKSHKANTTTTTNSAMLRSKLPTNTHLQSVTLRTRLPSATTIVRTATPAIAFLQRVAKGGKKKNA